MFGKRPSIKIQNEKEALKKLISLREVTEEILLKPQLFINFRIQRILTQTERF